MFIKSYFKQSRRLLGLALIVLVLAALFVVPALAAPADGASPEGSPWTFTADAAFLTATAAAILALLFDYAGGLAEWYDRLSDIQQRQLMGGLLLLVSVGVFLGQCFSIFVTNLSCTQTGAMDLLYQFLLAIGVNQGTHLMFKPTLGYKIKNFKVSPYPSLKAGQ